MSDQGIDRAGDVRAMLADVEALYQDVHGHPESSVQEDRTAASAAQHLEATGFDVTTDVGHTGAVVVLRNGDGPPTNHNPRFAPALHPTLETGVRPLVAAATAWLGNP